MWKKVVPLLVILGLVAMTAMSSGCVNIGTDTRDYMPTLGITFHSVGGGYEKLEGDLDNLEPGAIRWDVSWRKAVPEEGNPDEAYIAEVINYTHSFHEKGFEQILVFWQPPDWVEKYPIEVFTDYYIEYLDLFLPYVEAEVIQIANEPNHAYHSPYLVANILQSHEFFFRSGEHVKLERPDMDTCVNIITIAGWKTVMDTLFEDQYSRSFIDIVALDVYPGTWQGGSNPWTDVRTYLNKLDSDGYSGYRGAIMETGYSTPTIEVNAEANQENFYEESITELVDLLTGYNYKISSESSIDYLILYTLENSDSRPARPEHNFGLVVYGAENATIYYRKPAYYDVKDLFQNYDPTITGSLARLPFYGSGVSYLVYGLVWLSLYALNFMLGALVYPLSDKGEFLKENFSGKDLGERFKMAARYTSGTTTSLLILGLLPTQTLLLLVLVPIVTYFTTKRSIVYTVLSLVSMVIVALVFLLLSLYGYFIL